MVATLRACTLPVRADARPPARHLRHAPTIPTTAGTPGVHPRGRAPAHLLPWWLASLERVTKTFGQSLAAGLTGAVLLSDVDWPVVLQAALGAAFISLLRLILATLPANPTAQPVVVVQSLTAPRTAGVPGTLHVDESGIIGREPDQS